MTSRKLFSPKQDWDQGFTLLELIMVIALLSILTVSSITVINDSLDESRFEETRNELESIRTALIGNPDLKTEGLRSSFGYQGDLGALPTNGQKLDALLTNPGHPAWSVNATIRFGLGWNGPYVESSLSGMDITRDAWGNSYLYNSAINPATITSYGSDGAPGGTGLQSDLSVTVPNALIRASVHGFISDGANPYTGTATVELYQPNGNGATSTLTQNVVSADNGYFVFNNVSMGTRSIKMWFPSQAAPVLIVGPTPIIVDQNNYVIPNSVTSYSLGGGGAGGSCATGKIAFVGGSASLAPGNKILNYSINILANITVTQAKVTYGNSATFNLYTMDGQSYDCTLPGQFAPCPSSTGTTMSFNPSMGLTTGSNRAAQIQFNSNMNTTSTVIQVTHNLGCDTLTITGY